MKYVITESQEKRLHFLRRLNTDDTKELIRDIVDEGTDIYDVCDFNKVNDFIKEVIQSSADTLLLNWIDYKDEGFEELRKFVAKQIHNDYVFDLYHYYFDRKKEC